MNEFTKIGIGIMVFALLFFSMGIIPAQFKRKISNCMLFYISLALILNIVASIFLFAGSEREWFSTHGALGYIALLVLMIVCLKIWNIRIKIGGQAEINEAVNLFLRFSYVWWLFTFFTGVVQVAIN